MSLDHVLANLGLRRDPNSLEAQLHNMRREVRRISRTLSQRAGDLSDDWGNDLHDIGREAARHGAHFAEVASDQAWRSAKAIKRDPLPAIAVVGTILLLANLLRR